MNEFDVKDMVFEKQCEYESPSTQFDYPYIFCEKFNVNTICKLHRKNAKIDCYQAPGKSRSPMKKDPKGKMKECLNHVDPELWKKIGKCDYFACCTNPRFIQIFGHNFACKANSKSENIPDLCILKQHFKKKKKRGLEKFLSE